MSVERRSAILKKLMDSVHPITGSELADYYNVSRQVIVQDIAIIRASGTHVIATSNGYLIQKQTDASKLIKTFVSKHDGFERMEEELKIIVEFGGKIIDVIVEHPVYGEIVGALHLGTMQEVDAYIEKIKSTNARPLSILTEGDHIHTIEVPSEKIYELIIDELTSKGFI